VTAVPPTDVRPTRRRTPDRSAGLALAVAAAVLAGVVGGCDARPPAPASAAPAPSSSDAERNGDGLLVANGGALGVTEAGALVRFGGPDDATDEVVAGGGVIVAIGAAGMSVSDGPAGEPRSWRLLEQPDRADANPRLVGMSPGGTTLARVIGELQGHAFDLELMDLAAGPARRISVTRGLDGAPIWIGPSMVAVHVIREDQESGFAVVDLATDGVADIQSYGFTLSASADGGRVAFDDAATGEVLIGERADMNDAGLARMTRLENGSGAAADRVALSPDGRRLAIVRRTDTGRAIELLVEVDGTWRSAGVIPIRGEGTASVAWLR
jgi:hypothetical protein